MALWTKPPHLKDIRLGTDIYKVYHYKSTQRANNLKTNIAIKKIKIKKIDES